MNGSPIRYEFRACAKVVRCSVNITGQNSVPFLQGFIEQHIARKRGKLNSHLKMWQKVISFSVFICGDRNEKNGAMLPDNEELAGALRQ